MDGLISASVCHSRTVQQTPLGIIPGGLMHAVCFQGLSIRPVRCFRGIYPTVCENSITKQAVPCFWAEYAWLFRASGVSSWLEIVPCTILVTYLVGWFSANIQGSRTQSIYVQLFLGVDFFPGQGSLHSPKGAGLGRSRPRPAVKNKVDEWMWLCLSFFPCLSTC